jgi:hypothetical protein
MGPEIFRSFSAVIRPRAGSDVKVLGKYRSCSRRHDPHHALYTERRNTNETLQTKSCQTTTKSFLLPYEQLNRKEEQRDESFCQKAFSEAFG